MKRNHLFLWLLLGVSCSIQVVAQNYKALQFTTTSKAVWQGKRVPVSSTVVGTPQVVYKSDDVESTFQAWGTCFNELDWHALARIPAEAQERFFIDMFSPTGDLRFALGRIPVGASDYAGQANFYDLYHERNEGIDLSGSWYSCDEMPVGETDFQMEHFTIERDKQFIIPFIKKAQEQNPDMKFWASPWSPPQWMKHSHHYSNRAGYGNGLDTTYPTYTSTQFIMEEDYLNAYALYFSKFINAYGEEGIPVTGLCYQNEAYTCSYYPNTSWEALSTARFNADYLIPYMREHHPGVKVWLGTMNTAAVEDVYEVVLNYESKHADYAGKKLSEMFDGIAFQWEGRNAIGTMRERYPDLEFIQSESECGGGTFDWAAGTHTFELIHHYLNNGCVTYTNWNSILGGNGRGPFMNWWQNALLHLDLNKNVAYYTPEYYAYKHYSHFIGDGTQILTKTSHQPLVLAARQPNGTYVVVAGNDTNNEKSFTVAIDNDKYLTLNLPAASYNTFVVGEETVVDSIATAEGIVSSAQEVTDCTDFIVNPTVASLDGWTNNNVAVSEDYHAMVVLGQQALNSMSTEFTSMDNYQEIKGLPAGEYYATCISVCGEGNINDQHLYLSLYEADGTFVKTVVSPVKQNDLWDVLSWELQTTESVELTEGQYLRLGYASTSGGGTKGWYAVTDFHLYRYGADEAAAAEQAQKLAEARASYETLLAEAQEMVKDVDGLYEEAPRLALSAVIEKQTPLVDSLTDPLHFADLSTELEYAMNAVRSSQVAAGNWYQVKEINFNGGVTTGVSGGNFGVTGSGVTTEMLWVGCGGATSLWLDNPTFSTATKWKIELVVALDASVDAGIWFKNGGTDKVSINSMNASHATVKVNEENMGAVMPVNNGNHANNDAGLIRSRVTLIGSEDAVRIIITDLNGETVYLDRTVSGFFNIDNIGFFGDTGWNSFAYVDDVKCLVAEIPVTIGDSGKATFCSDIPLDFSKGEVTAYVASSATGAEVTLSKVEVIPALTGVYLKAEPGVYSIAVPAEATAPTTNYLKGVITSTVVYQTEGDNTNFFLSAEGFKKAVESSTLAGGKAYLSLPNSMFANEVNVLSIKLDDMTAIEETLLRPAENGVLYDLSGRRIEQPKRGIYIQGGKKVLFK